MWREKREKHGDREKAAGVRVSIAKTDRGEPETGRGIKEGPY